MNKRILYASVVTGIVGLAVIIGLLTFIVVTANRTLTVVTEIHNNVTSPKYGLAAIKNEIGSISSTTHSILVNNETGHEQIWLPAVPGITYLGHVSLNTADYPVCKLPKANCFPDPVIVICGLPGHAVNDTSTVAIQPASATPVILGQSMINDDFLCTSLSEDGVSNTTGIYGIIQYQIVKG